MALGGTTGHTMRDRGPGAGLGIAAILGVLALARTGWLEPLELAVFDRIGPASRAELSPSASQSAVALVSIGESDFEAYGYPIPDDVLARALARLVDSGASAIGVDLYRPAPASADARDLAAWTQLAAVAQNSPRLVFTELLPAPDAPGISAPRFARPEQIGFNNMLVDPGRVVRRGYLYAWDEDGSAHVSLALRLASLHLADAGVAVGPDPEEAGAVKIGATPLPPLDPEFGGYVGLDAGGYQIPLDFERAATRFENLRFGDLLAGRVPKEKIAQRVVVVGTDAPSVKDDFNSSSSQSEIVKGYRLHAELADQLIRAGLHGDVPLRSESDAIETALTVGFGLAALMLVIGIGASGLVVPVLVVGLALPFVLSALLRGRGIWLPSVVPALAWAAAGGLALAARAHSEARAQRQLASLFRRFSSSTVAEELWRQRDAIMEGGRPRPRRVVLTALISDLEGFTQVAEKLEPERLLEWIDGYLGAMTRVIEEHGGHVDDYAGDGIKANFGVPIPSESEAERTRDACRAVACALAMGRALADCNRAWAAAGLPLARQRIGVYTGPAVVGAVGSESRMKYTSLGDTINAAARLESVTEPAARSGDEDLQRVLIGESTRCRLGDAFLVEDLGLTSVKGRSEPIHIFRVLGERVAESQRGRA